MARSLSPGIGPVTAKMPPRSLASPNLFPAEFSFPNGDRLNAGPASGNEEELPLWTDKSLQPIIGPVTPKVPRQSLASPNLFPAEFSLPNRDRFECQQRPVRVQFGRASAPMIG
jgi:hypothetical protein